MKNNLHVTMSSFTFGSRILKETASLVRAGVVQHVYIAGLQEDDLKEYEEIDASRSVWRVRLKSRNWSRNLLIQIIKYCEFCVRVVQFARVKGIDIVNVHQLALLPLGVLVKWFCGANLIYDAHELETETFVLGGFRQVAARRVERILIKYADLVIVVSDGINAWYRGRYGLSNIVTVLNCPESSGIRRNERLRQELGIPEGRKIVIYQGALVPGRGIEALLNAFAGFDDDEYVLVLMGFGELEPLVNEYVAKHDNIYFQRAVAPSVVLDYTASADVGVSYIDNPSLNDKWCLPNKLFEYISAGRPVIVSDLPEMRRVVDENLIGIVLKELTSASLKYALDEISRFDSGVLAENLKRAASRYSWHNQERVMIGAYRTFIFGESRSQAG